MGAGHPNCELGGVESWSPALSVVINLWSECIVTSHMWLTTYHVRSTRETFHKEIILLHLSTGYIYLPVTFTFSFTYRFHVHLFYLQVTSMAVHLLQDAERVQTVTLEIESCVVTATLADPYLILLTQSGELVHLVYKETKQGEYWVLLSHTFFCWVSQENRRRGRPGFESRRSQNCSTECNYCHITFVITWEHKY